MAQTFQQYMEEALHEAGYTDAEVSTALAKVYAHEKLGPKLNGLVKNAVEDYQAQVGRVRSLEEKDRSRDREMQDYYQRVNAEHKKVVDELAALKGGAAPTFDEAKYLSKEDFTKGMQEMGGRFASVLKDATTITALHVSKYGEAPDLEAIEKIATEQGLPIRAAYDKYVEPRAKEQEKKDREKWETDRRAEIERDIRSQHKLPVDSRPAETAPVYQRVAKDKIPADMDSELLAAWHGGDK